MAHEIKGLIAGLAAGVGVVGAAYGVSSIATHGKSLSESQGRAVVQTPNTAKTPASSQLVAAGRGFYLISCVDCHGKDGSGRIGPTLHQLGDPDSKIAASIRNGFSGKMPGFQDQYNAAQISALVDYIQSLH